MIDCLITLASPQLIVCTFTAISENELVRLPFFCFHILVTLYFLTVKPKNKLCYRIFLTGSP